MLSTGEEGAWFRNVIQCTIIPLLDFGDVMFENLLNTDTNFNI